MKPNLSVIIPTKNEERNIKRCLKSFLPFFNKNKALLELIVVDNHSTDRTTAIAKRLGARVFTAGPERSAQRNLGAQKAKSKLLFFVDADMTVDKNLITETINLFKQSPHLKAAIVPETSVGNNYWAKVRSLERRCYFNIPMIEAARIFEKKAFLRNGGFDKKLIAAEDWDLTFRFRKLGPISRLKAKITHHEDQLSLVNHLKKKYYYASNVKHYAQKHPARFKAQSGGKRIFILLKSYDQLLADPGHALGVFTLKFAEYLIFIFARIINQ